MFLDTENETYATQSMNQICITKHANFADTFSFFDPKCG